MSGTPRFDLQFLSAGQAQKEITVNQSLQTLDILTCPTVQQALLNDPPASPTVGSCYVVGTSPTGAWAGNAQSIAAYTSGGWRFVAPVEGMSVYVIADSRSVRFRSGAWEAGVVRGSSLVFGGVQVVGGQQPAIAAPTGGTTVDNVARTSISQFLAALQQHGLIAP